MTEIFVSMLRTFLLNHNFRFIFAKRRALLPYK